MSAWLDDFRRKCRVDAVEFADLWQKHDADGNGFIEGEEIDCFFDDIITMGSKGKEERVTREQLKRNFMQEFDENKDGKIEMAELAKLLPNDEAFLSHFRSDCSAITGHSFMKCWKKFAGEKDFIEKEQIQAFVADLLADSEFCEDAARLDDYAASVLRIFDADKDGKLTFNELSRLLPSQENILLRFKDRVALSSTNFQEIFNHYDQDGNGSISGEELDVFLTDVAQSISPELSSTTQEIQKLKKMLLKCCDTSGDGCLQREELALWLGVQ